LASTNALLEELLLHRVPRQRERFLEVLARHLIAPAAEFELTERRVVEWISVESIAVGKGANLFESPLRTLVLRDGDGAVECNYRGGTSSRSSISASSPAFSQGISRARHRDKDIQIGSW
jgi:hypothetical protein